MATTACETWNAEVVPDIGDVVPSARASRRRRRALWRAFRPLIPTLIAAVLVGGAALLLAVPRSFTAANADPSDDGYYQRLADGFLHGELSIRERPPNWLVRARNPYDPDVNRQYLDGRYGVWDSTLSDGRIYYYWGPAPVVFAVLPARLVGVHWTETDLGIAALIVMVFAACWTVRLLVERWRVPGFVEFLLAVTASSFFAGFHLLRWVGIWQAAVLIAGALGMLACAFFVKAVLASNAATTRRGATRTRIADRAWLFGGVCLALAVGTRVSYLIFGLIPVFLVLAVWRELGNRRHRVRVLTAALSPSAVMFVLLAVYNALRFGSPTDLGVTRTLSFGFDQSKVQLSSMRYIAPNAYYYALRPFSVTPIFPFLQFDRHHWPFGIPSDYSLPFEPVAGFVFTSPFLVVGIAVAVVGVCAARWRHDLRVRIAMCFAIVGLVQLAFVSYATYGATERYEVEVEILLTVSAVSAFLFLWALPRRDLARWLMAGCLLVVAAGTFVLALLGGFRGMYPDQDSGNWFRRQVQRATEPVERALVARHPYVQVQSPYEAAPVLLNDSFTLSEEVTIYTHSRGCAVRIVMVRSRGDHAQLVLNPEPGLEATTSGRRLIVDVSAARRSQASLRVGRDDALALTPIVRAKSRYVC